MKTKVKKSLSLIMTVLMLVTMFPMSVFAEKDILSYLSYEIVDGEVTITDCDTSISGDVVIPDTIEGYPVTMIGDNAFSWCESLTEITIADSVTIISNDAFQDCTSLTEITIPDSVASIGDGAFYNCKSLTEITIPDSVTSIGYSAFHGCISLTEITIPDGVTSIGSGAFEYCRQLVCITIPDSVITIGDYAFSDCDKLTNITVNENNTHYSSNKDGVLFNKNKTQLLKYPQGNSRTEYVIPERVTTIGTDAFSNCISLESITIPDSVTTIGTDAFSDCDSLTEIMIPDSVTTIGSCAFANCDRLVSVTIGDSVTTIEFWAFMDCFSLTEIIIPDSVITIGETVFYGCDALKDVYYSGTQEQWNNIDIGINNECLTNANIHTSREYNFNTDRWSFSNLDETISSDIYKTAYGTIKGAWLYYLYESRSGSHGHCYGMSSTTAALLKYPSAINSFESSYTEGDFSKTLSDINPGYKSNLFGVDARTYIKYGYIYQFDKNVQKVEKDSKNNIQGLYNAVKNYVNETGSAVIFNVFHNSLFGQLKDGHSVLAVGLRESDDYYYILINDSNPYNKIQELKISKDFSEWDYTVDGYYSYTSKNGSFTYSFPADAIYEVGLYLKDNQKAFMSNNNKLVASTGKILTEMDIEEIIEPKEYTAEHDNEYYLYWLNDDESNLSLISQDDSEVTVSDINSSVSATINAGAKAQFNVDDDGFNSVTYKSKTDDNTVVTFVTANENDNAIKITVNGKSSGTEVTAIQTETGLNISGISDGTVTLAKDDEIIATQEIKNDIDNFEITYDKSGDNEKINISYSNNCSHICHKTGFLGFLAKIAIFFWRLFGTNPVCECGMAHY